VQKSGKSRSKSGSAGARSRGSSTVSQLTSASLSTTEAGKSSSIEGERDTTEGGKHLAEAGDRGKDGGNHTVQGGVGRGNDVMEGERLNSGGNSREKDITGGKGGNHAMESGGMRQMMGSGGEEGTHTQGVSTGEGARDGHGGGVVHQSMEQSESCKEQAGSCKSKFKARVRCGYSGCREPMSSEILYALTAEMVVGKSCAEKMVCATCYERFCMTGMYVCVYVCVCVCVCVYVCVLVVDWVAES
jgi:hypothetical protein